MISRCAFLSIGLMAVCLMVASVFAAEAEDGAGGAAKNEARLLVGKHVRYFSIYLLLSKVHFSDFFKDSTTYLKTIYIILY